MQISRRLSRWSHKKRTVLREPLPDTSCTKRNCQVEVARGSGPRPTNSSRFPTLRSPPVPARAPNLVLHRLEPVRAHPMSDAPNRPNLDDVGHFLRRGERDLLLGRCRSTPCHGWALRPLAPPPPASVRSSLQPKSLRTCFAPGLWAASPPSRTHSRAMWPCSPHAEHSREPLPTAPENPPPSHLRSRCAPLRHPWAGPVSSRETRFETRVRISFRIPRSVEPASKL